MGLNYNNRKDIRVRKYHTSKVFEGNFKRIMNEKEIFKDPKFCNSDKEECYYLYLGKCKKFNEFLCCDSTVFNYRSAIKCDKCKKYFNTL